MRGGLELGAPRALHSNLCQEQRITFGYWWWTMMPT